MLLRFLTSFKTVLILIGSLIVLSLISSLIPQGLPPAHYQALAGRLGAWLIRVTGFDSVFRSWPFLAVLGLLSASLAVCTWRRIRRGFALWGKRNFAGCEGKEFTVPGPLPAISERIGALSAELGPLVRVRGGADTIEVRRSGFAVFGSGMFHSGLLLVLVGGLLTAVFSDSVILRAVEGRWTVHDSGRARVFLKKFTAEFYAENVPRSYTSDAAVEVGSSGVRDARIGVNRPFSLSGFQFVQSGYGVSSELREAVVEISSPGRQPLNFSLASGATQSLGGGARVRYDRYYSDYSESNGIRRNLSGEHRNPVLFLRFESPGSTRDLLLKFGNRAAVPTGFEGVGFRFVSGTPAFYSDLRVTSDPGLPAVWTGFILLIPGLFAVFFLEPVFWRFEFRELDAGRSTRVTVRRVLVPRRGQAAVVFEKIISVLERRGAV